jgi:phosphohistidine phosphatase
MILYIIRHAWAAPYDESTGLDDALRPLTSEGRERFARMVQTLIARGFSPQIIASSPLVRCRQTAEVVAEEVQGKPEIVLRDELAPGSDLAAILKWTFKQAPREEIAWVGHMPDVSYLAGALIGETGGGIDFGKGAVAAIRFDDLPQLGQGELRWLVTAKMLGC